jgi:hypothetical protein
VKIVERGGDRTMTQISRSLWIIGLCMLISGCAYTPPKTNFDFADEAIKQKDWILAYRLIENSLISQDVATRNRAIALVDTYPNIHSAATKSFSIESLSKSKAINKQLAWKVEKDRLASFQRSIATPEQFAQAEENYRSVFNDENNNSTLAEKRVFPVTYPDPSYRESIRKSKITARYMNEYDLLSDDERRSATAGKVIGSAALLFPPVAAEFLGRLIGTGIAKILDGTTGPTEKLVISEFTRDNFITLLSDRFSELHAVDNNQLTKTPDPEAKIELLVDKFYIDPELCFYVDAYLLIKISGKTIYSDHMSIGQGCSSEDSPPYECANQECLKYDFNRCESEMALLYSQALVTMTIRRLNLNK